jgi:hypothetical protein
MSQVSCSTLNIQEIDYLQSHCQVIYLISSTELSIEPQAAGGCRTLHAKTGT